MPPRFLFLSLLLIIACSRGPAPVADPVTESGPYLTIFLIDGLANDLFRAELAAGNLPEIARMMREGTTVRRGIASFPSISGFAHYPYLTGEVGTASGMFGLRWFDRSRREGNFRNYVGRTHHHMDGDISDSIATIFELCPDARGATYNTVLAKGAPRQTVFGAEFLVSKYARFNPLVMALNGIMQVFNILPKAGRWEDLATTHRDIETKVIRRAIRGIDAGERIQFIVFATPDNINHIEGYRSDEGPNPRYVSQLRVIDELIGEYRRHSAAAGTEERRLYLLTSDHGVVTVDRNVSIVAELQDRHGLRYDRDTAVRKSSHLARPLSDYVEERIDVVQALQGNTMCFLYFRNPAREGEAAWHAPLTAHQVHDYPVRGGAARIDLVAEVLGMEGVEFVMHRTAIPGGIRVASREGCGEIRAVAGEGYSWRVIRGADPFGYGDTLRDRPLSDDAWLAATHGHRYPYAVPLVARLLTAHRDADLVVTTEAGYDHGRDFEFIVGNYRGGHGGLGADQLVVPMILCGPGIRQGQALPYARPEDIGRIVRHLMGTPVAPERLLAAALSQPATDPPAGQAGATP